MMDYDTQGCLISWLVHCLVLANIHVSLETGCFLLRVKECKGTTSFYLCRKSYPVTDPVIISLPLQPVCCTVCTWTGTGVALCQWFNSMCLAVFI